MTKQELPQRLRSTGMPVAYHHFGEGQEPEKPYLVYLQSGTRNFSADGRVYLKNSIYQIELYTEYKDEKAEDRVEEALSSAFWNKTETFIEPENMYQTTYEIEV